MLLERKHCFASKVLSFGNPQINLGFRSLIRTFVPKKENNGNQESGIYSQRTDCFDVS